MYQYCSASHPGPLSPININETPFGIARQAMLVFANVGWTSGMRLVMYFSRRRRRWPAEEANYGEEPGREPVDRTAPYEIYEIWYESAGR
jgi:hypothetical protein